MWQLDWGEEDSDEIVPRTLWVSNGSAIGTLWKSDRSGTTAPIEYPHWASFEANSNRSYAPPQIC